MTDNLINEISKDDLRKLAIVGTHLHQWQGNDKQDILNVFKQQAMVQLDPLNPAGRNHDIFFFSRIKDYQIDDFQKVVYPRKEVFETYFPNLMAVAKEYFSLFLPQMKKEFMHKYYQSRIEKMEKLHEGILDEAREFILKNGPCKAADLDEMASVKPEFTFWKTSHLAGMSLEMLWLLGRAVIVERDSNWRKIYGLTENYFNDTTRREVTLSDDEISYQKFIAKQKSYPLVDLGKVQLTKNNKLSIGKRKRVSPDWFLKDDEISPKIVTLEDSQKGMAVPSNWEEILKSKTDDEMRVIAPLDPLIWNRELLLHVFDFDYTWEVYKIPKDRKWGYYVYPLLYQNQLIGRLEAKFDKKKKIISFFNFQKEEIFEFDSSSNKALHDLLERWKQMLGADQTIFHESILSIK
ncbi:MAG: winged helix DNA-binding domain-containing protein [Candidatus Heimdallarchaeota archaeon]|nr:winged helix DNA-binding domain-containing protein [Candidatus Heimdallarchaeota archaeon]